MERLADCVNSNSTVISKEALYALTNLIGLADIETIDIAVFQCKILELFIQVLDSGST
jgi:hypothetical protein